MALLSFGDSGLGKWWPLRENGPGVQRYHGDIIVDIIDPSQVEVQLAINEFDFNHVDVGMTVHIEIPALQNSLKAPQLYWWRWP